MHGASQRADHARRDTRLKAERIADRDHDLANSQVFRLSEPDMNEIRRINPDNREIGIGIVSN